MGRGSFWGTLCHTDRFMSTIKLETKQQVQKMPKDYWMNEKEYRHSWSFSSFSGKNLIDESCRNFWTYRICKSDKSYCSGKHTIQKFAWLTEAKIIWSLALRFGFSTVEFCAPVWLNSSDTKNIDFKLNKTMRIFNVHEKRPKFARTFQSTQGEFLFG